MGCLKLTYYEGGRDLGIFRKNLKVVYAKRGFSEKKALNYYPFGEVLPGRNSNPTGMFGYQGQERISNATNEVSGSRWYNFQLRMYNPSLGRFNTIDPYSQFNSPYLAMANNPISFVDPDGGRARSSDYDDYGKLKLRRFILEEQDREWWRQNRHYFRTRGGDYSGANFYYHMMNVELLGSTIPVDNLDINSRGPDGSIHSGERNKLMGTLIASYQKPGDLGERFGAEQAAASFDLNLMAMNIWSGNLAMDKFNAIVAMEGGTVVYDKRGNVIGHTTNDLERGDPIYNKAQSSRTGKIFNVGEIKGYAVVKVVNFHELSPSMSGGGFNKYQAEGDFMSDMLFGAGLMTGGVGSAFQSGADYNGGIKLYGKLAQKEVNAGVLFGKVAKGARIIGVVASSASIGISINKFDNIQGKSSWGQRAQLGTSVVGNGLTMSKNPYTLGFGISINVAEYYGGFNSDYQYLDKIEQINNPYFKYGLLFHKISGGANIFK